MLSDRFINAFDRGLRTLLPPKSAQSKPKPALRHGGVTEPTSVAATGAALSDNDAQLSIALMRVNHAGEVAAQALYLGQGLFARTAAQAALLDQAAKEEADHLTWCRARLDALGGRPSVLDPAWFAGSFAIGAFAAAFGDKTSLAFLRATEEQVEAHLTDHLSRLPEADTESRAVVERMRADEARHAKTATEAGGFTLPPPVQLVMRGASKVMTTLAAKV